VREEKARLYQSAVAAWERGEVTSALDTLEKLAALDRDYPDPETGRGSTYRNFYAQVHSESDTIKKGYDDARQQFMAGNLDAAMELCRQYLAKYPTLAHFQALQSEIEARQRPPAQAPSLAQAIVETERRVEEEPDLDRRAAILEAALKQYPGDPHFVSSLQAVRDLRDVVNSMVSKARFFEDTGQFSDALDQWHILKSIHPKQPGLASEIQRLTSRRDQAAPKPAPPKTKSPWAEQARKYIDTGDYQRAMQALMLGAAESATDPELLMLEEEVREGQDRANKALELLGQSHDEINKGQMEQGLASLRQAYRIDSRNAVIRTVLVNGLLEQARRKMDSDPSGANALVQEVLRIEPNHSQAQILAAGIADRKAAPPPLFAPVTPTAAPPGQPSPASFRQAETIAMPASVAESVTGSTAQRSVPPAPPVAAPTPQRPAPRPPAKPGHPKKLILGTAAAAGLLVLIALGVTLARHKKPQPPPPPASKYSVVLRSTPEGAEIKINGESCGISTCTKELAPGTYQVEAQLTGYQNANMPIVVGPGAAKEFPISLSPQGPRVTIFTDLADGGTVSLDDAPAGQIQGGGAEVPNLNAGKHVLAVKGGDSTASIPVEISPGAAPTLTGAIDAKNVRCFLVAGYGGNARVYGSGTGYRVSLDGKPLGALTADGLPLLNLSPGSHELVMDSDAQHDRMDFESQPSATLYVSLGTAQNLGTLSVETNEDQAHLLINGQKYKRDTARGRLVVYLFPKKYTVTVQKDGFAPAAEQTVEVKRGENVKVSFTLTAAKAILAVHHAPPGSDVLVDNISRGTVHSDGEFQVGGIDPGRHTVTLRHDGFKPMQSEQTFAGGKTVDLNATLEAAPTTGTLRFEIGPPGVEVHIRIRREGEPQDHEVTGPSVAVQEGKYLVSATAAQYSPNSTTVQVPAGGTAVATMTMKHVETKAAPKGPTLVFGLEDWLKLPGWSAQEGSVVRKGGDWAMATPDISQGTIRFTVVSIKGRHVEWGVACRDEKNFIHYELDDKNLTRYEVRNGSKLGQIKVPHGLDKKKPMGISLAVTPQSVVISVNREGWVDIDKWDVEGSSVHGRFGFRIPGSDEIGLQDFQIVP
jgi:tetratricopeptide (TPR) repeat protein